VLAIKRANRMFHAKQKKTLYLSIITGIFKNSYFYVNAKHCKIFLLHANNNYVSTYYNFSTKSVMMFVLNLADKG
jgi:hypothetical protein